MLAGASFCSAASQSTRPRSKAAPPYRQATAPHETHMSVAHGGYTCGWPGHLLSKDRFGEGLEYGRVLIRDAHRRRRIALVHVLFTPGRFHAGSALQSCVKLLIKTCSRTYRLAILIGYTRRRYIFTRGCRQRRLRAACRRGGARAASARCCTDARRHRAHRGAAPIAPIAARALG